jgi:PAS domain S-box-containing protein
MSHQAQWRFFMGAAQSAPGDALDRQFARWRSWLPFSRLTIAARMMAIVLTLAVPLNLVIIAVIWHLSEGAMETQRASLLYTARSVAAAADAKLGEYIALAQALARSPALLEDNLDGFEAEARRIFASTAEAWVMVADLAGQQLINTGGRPGQRLPPRNATGLATQKRAFEARSIIIGGPQYGAVSQSWLVNIEVPIFKDGEPVRALAVAVKAQSFFQLLNDQQIPRNWLAGIVDGQGRFIARVPSNGRYVGELASESWRKVKDQDGVFELVSLEGDELVDANAHSPVSGWLIGIAVKKAEMQAAVWNAIRWATILGGGFSVLSLFFAGAIARSITRPIEELRGKASVLLAEPAPAMALYGPPEVRELCQALKQSAANRDRSDQALRESEERFRGIFERAGTGIAITDFGGRFCYCNPAYIKILGYTEQELRQLAFPKLVHPEDRDANMSQCQRLIAREIPSFDIVNRYVGKDGKPLWVDKHVFLLRDSASRPCNMAVLVTDITERKRHEDQIRLLMHEVNHRSKNMLTLVQAIARQTLAAKHEDFLERFGARVQALAASQDLLVKNAWTGADVEDLVRSQLAHFEDLIGRQIELQGPQLFVSAQAAQTIGMALHELATNAGKYGALASGDGRIEISWSMQHGKTGEAFIMSWREQCAHPVVAPSKHGFGSTVICEVTNRSLGATVDLDFPVTGLTWRLQCAAGEVLDRIDLAGRSEGEKPAHNAPGKLPPDRFLVPGVHSYADSR